MRRIGGWRKCPILTSSSAATSSCQPISNSVSQPECQQQTRVTHFWALQGSHRGRRGAPLRLPTRYRPWSTKATWPRNATIMPVTIWKLVIISQDRRALGCWGITHPLITRPIISTSKKQNASGTNLTIPTLLRRPVLRPWLNSAAVIACSKPTSISFKGITFIRSTFPPQEGAYSTTKVQIHPQVWRQYLNKRIVRQPFWPLQKLEDNLVLNIESIRQPYSNRRLPSDEKMRTCSKSNKVVDRTKSLRPLSNIHTSSDSKIEDRVWLAMVGVSKQAELANEAKREASPFPIYLLRRWIDFWPKTRQIAVVTPPSTSPRPCSTRSLKKKVTTSDPSAKMYTWSKSNSSTKSPRHIELNSQDPPFSPMDAWHVATNTLRSKIMAKDIAAQLVRNRFKRLLANQWLSDRVITGDL